ncbi:RusA family crossover junction endodeoxyribonuclease [Lactobacillus iners]|uniref:RusA family crossover junction endodeoxyribonuclease n=1 Tax=Lactobacillus iners TaxID=147802 RepID=UPI0001E5DEAF|nr:crossover junction endodeoxyribonuclease RusA [Lactobacillus iners LactinV 03V1-b]MCT7739151.1 RusA family crossover junction endodeoxyribonuclease [Lactobacillus iners]
MRKWEIVLPFAPMSTPRPKFRYIPSQNKVISYYGDARYPQYLENIHNYIEFNHMYNENFFDIIHSQDGIIADVNFYCSMPKNKTRVKNILKTTAPDIDNLLKAILDGIFNELLERDSRVVGIRLLKFNELINPRTEVTFTSVNDIFNDKSQFNSLLQTANIYGNWSTIYDFAPIAAPRPQFSKKKRLQGKKKETYKPNKYANFLENMSKHMEVNGLYNEDFYNVLTAPHGVIANVNYYCQTPKSQKTLTKLMKLTAPDIDNLLKATLDGIFNPLSVRDSRVVGVKALKFNEIEDPRTEVSLIGI